MLSLKIYSDYGPYAEICKSSWPVTLTLDLLIPKSLGFF